MKVIYDIDGTLAKFLLVGPDIWSKKGYSKNLPQHKNMVGSAKLLSKKAEVYSASAAINAAHAIPDKNFWIDNVVPEIKLDNRIYTKYGENKSDVINQKISIEPGDVFLDDYTPNLIEMQKAFPDLVCIKVLNDINDHQKTWTGPRISIHSSPEAIASQIIGLSLAAKVKEEFIKNGV